MPDSLSQAGLGTLSAAVRRRLKQILTLRLRPHDLTIQQFWVLLVLLEQGPKSLHALAQQVWMDDPTASRVVKAMAGRKLLTIQSDPNHGRRIVISLAPASLPLAQELQHLAQRLKADIVAGLSPYEQAIVRRGLLTLISNLDGLLAEAPAGADEADEASEAS